MEILVHIIRRIFLGGKIFGFLVIGFDDIGYRGFIFRGLRGFEFRIIFRYMLRLLLIIIRIIFVVVVVGNIV